MRLAPALLSTLLVLGCNEVPSAPVLPESASVRRAIPSTAVPKPGRPPRGRGPAKVWGMIVGDDGGCLDGATADVLDGPLAGLRVRQSSPCEIWWVAGGFWIHGLYPGTGVTIRASAPGYASAEQDFVPTVDHFQVQAIVLEPLKPDR
jgi:hypothetical protein